MQIIGQLLSNRYLIESYVDEGGMSIIYKAVDISNNQYVAIKALKPEYSSDIEFTKRFFNEAKASYNMSHPNIVALLNVDEDKGIFYLCFEYVEGDTLKQHIQKNGPIPIQESVRIAIQMLWALDHAHSKNIIHRDIKPQNVILDLQGNAKILDFGIARIPNSQTLTSANTAIGTVQYVSPEQASGKEITTASDIYSMGIVLYEMLTGKLPFDSEDILSILTKQINESPVPPSKLNTAIPAKLELIVLTALEKLPENRYQSVGEMIDDLNQFTHGGIPKIAYEKQEKIKEKQQEIVKPSASQRVMNKTKRSVKKHYTIFLWTVPIFLICLTLILFIGVSWISGLTKVVYAPDVQGLDHVRAMEIINASQLKPVVKFSYHNSVAENKVILQSPAPQEKLNKGDAMLIEVSRGKQVDLVPDLISQTMNQAYEKAAQMNFTINVVERVVDAQTPEGVIINQLTPAGEAFPSDRMLQVVVSGGSTFVPYVLQLKQQEALEKIGESKMQIGNISFQEVSDPALYNVVLEQTPEAQKEVIIATKMNLVIGNAPVLYGANIELLPTELKAGVLKIVLLENNEEVVKYEQNIELQQSALVIPVQSAIAGESLVKIYVNNVLIKTVKVVLE
ncbi:MAG: Stk1 family PASTA domain-containing Ser/Thr kinase [Eubacteriales bacterium]|nr:Stk1 family PASTA domain-containing Ser/Thr kinase [Eubacteriales bacterium]